MVLSMSVTAFAGEENTSSGCIGVSTEEPVIQDIVARGTGRPTAVWNIKRDGAYNFKGVSIYQTMYTNYRFVGTDSYGVEVFNNSERELTINVVDAATRNVIKSHKILPGGPTYFIISRFDVTSNQEFYLQFEGSEQDFNGTIKATS